MEKSESINKTWEADWAKAEKAADAYFAQKEESNEGQEEQLGSGSTEDGGPHASGDEGSSDGEEQALDSEEHSGGQGDRRGERDEPLEGRQQREGAEEVQDEQSGSGESVSEKPLTKSQRLAALKQEAADLGLEFDGSSVTTADRVNLREAKRKQRAKLQAEREEVEALLAQRTTEFEERLAKAEELGRAIESNDLDAIASIAGFDTWNKLSESALKRQLNPEHRELLKMRKEKADLEKQKAEQRKQAQERERQEQQQAARVEYREQLRDAIGTHKKYKVFANDPMFVNAVMNHQEREWDGEETISLDEAGERAYNEAKLVYDKLSVYFGSQTASQSEKRPSGEGQQAESESASETEVAAKPGRRPPKTVSHKSSGDSSGAPQPFSEKSWLEKWSTPMKNSSPSS